MENEDRSVATSSNSNNNNNNNNNTNRSRYRRPTPQEQFEEIEFLPTAVDVISTRLRTYNLKHPGNVFYTDLVHRRLMELGEIANDDHSLFRKVAQEIVDVLTTERGGRFLKLKEGDREHTHCYLMTKRAAVIKVTHALRTAQSRSAAAATTTHDTAATGTAPAAAPLISPTAALPQVTANAFSSQNDINKNNNNGNNNNNENNLMSMLPTPSPGVTPVSSPSITVSSPVPLSPLLSSTKNVDTDVIDDKNTKINTDSNDNNKRKESSPKGGIRQKKKKLRATAGDTPIHKYALDLLSAVCNYPEQNNAHFILDNPYPPSRKSTATKSQLTKQETDKDRQMRLQLRHRFVAAKTSGIKPIDFAKRLLNFWGGQLSDTATKKEPKKPKQQPKQRKKQTKQSPTLPDSAVAQSNNDSAKQNNHNHEMPQQQQQQSPLKEENEEVEEEENSNNVEDEDTIAVEVVDDTDEQENGEDLVVARIVDDSMADEETTTAEGQEETIPAAATTPAATSLSRQQPQPESQPASRSSITSMWPVTVPSEEPEDVTSQDEPEGMSSRLLFPSV